MGLKFVRTRGGKPVEHTFNTVYRRTCPRCDTSFETHWVRKLYCSRVCYMKGVTEKSRLWSKTPGGRAWHKKNRTDWARRWRVAALRKLGAKCVKCGFADFRALQVDHVNGGGHAERTLRKSIYRGIAVGLDKIGRYQLLCANCNWIKRFENNEDHSFGDYNQYLIDASKVVNTPNPHSS